MPPTLHHIVVLLWHVDTEMTAQWVQSVPWTVQFPVGLVMILSAGSATQSCVILLLSPLNCGLVCVPLWCRTEAWGRAIHARLSWRWELHYCDWDRPNTCFYSSEQVEFEEAGTGSGRGGRLGYKWKHFVYTAHQGLFRLGLLTPPNNIGLSFQLHFFIPCHERFLFTIASLDRLRISVLLLQSLSSANPICPFCFLKKTEYYMATSFCWPHCRMIVVEQSDVVHHGSSSIILHCDSLWQGAQTDAVFRPVADALHTAESKDLAVSLLRHNAITVATEPTNPLFPPAFVRKDKADTSWTVSAHKLQ